MKMKFFVLVLSCLLVCLHASSSDSSDGSVSSASDSLSLPSFSASLDSSDSIDIDALIDPFCEAFDLTEAQCDELKFLVALAIEAGVEGAELLQLILDLIQMIIGTDSPTSGPTASPTLAPTSPTGSPTLGPTDAPTSSPTRSPTAPTRTPTASPTTQPTTSPSTSPTTPPSRSPTISPTAPTRTPTSSPTIAPTAPPSNSPTTPPSRSPTISPTAPTRTPTSSPTSAPTAPPSTSPSAAPTRSPTATPTVRPTTGSTCSQTGFLSTTPDGIYSVLDPSFGSSESFVTVDTLDNGEVSAVDYFANNVLAGAVVSNDEDDPTWVLLISTVSTAFTIGSFSDSSKITEHASIGNDVRPIAISAYCNGVVLAIDLDNIVYEIPVGSVSNDEVIPRPLGQFTSEGVVLGMTYNHDTDSLLLTSTTGVFETRLGDVDPTTCAFNGQTQLTVTDPSGQCSVFNALTYVGVGSNDLDSYRAICRSDTMQMSTLVQRSGDVLTTGTLSDFDGRLDNHFSVIPANPNAGTLNCLIESDSDCPDIDEIPTCDPSA